MRKPRWLVVIAVLGAMTVLAAACNKSSNNTTTSGPVATTGSSPAPGGQPSACNAQFGCVVYKAGEPIKLGTLLSITGATAFLGKDSLEGVKLALEQRTTGSMGSGTIGQFMGHSVTLVNEDDGCSATGGQTGSQKLLSIPNIVAVIGTSCSSAALGVADKAFSSKGILLISPSNTNPNLTETGTHQPFYLRTAHNDKIQGAVVADFVFKHLGIKSAATIHDESPYADALAAVFRQDFETLGGTITPNGNQAINSTQTDFKPLLTTIGQDSPGYLYYPDFDPACALIAKQAKQVPGLANTKLGGSDGCLESAYLSTAGSSANGTFASGPDFSKLQVTNAFYRDKFLPAYQKETGGKPTAAFHAHAFDAVNILFDAIQKVAINQGGSLFIPREALKTAIFATSGYKGLTGTITCTPLGDCATAVTIGVFEAPNFPVQGGTGNGQAVFEETKTLASVGG